MIGIIYYPTLICTQECKHCYASSLYKALKRKTATREDVERAVIKLSEFTNNTGTKIWVNISGGEPLLNFDGVRAFVEKMRTLSEKWACVGFSLTTNLMVPERILHESLSYLRQNDVRIFVSYDTESLYRFRNQEEKKVWLKNLDILRQYYGENFKVRITTNRDLFEFDILEFAVNTGLKYIQVGHFRLLGRALEQDEKFLKKVLLSLEELALFFIAVNELSKSRKAIENRVKIGPSAEKIKEKYLQFLKKPEIMYICKGWGYCPAVFSIGPDGSVFFEDGCYTGRPVGHIDTFYEIFRSKEYCEMVKKRSMNPRCMQCSFFTLCRGGCISLRGVNRYRPSRECAGHRTFIEYILKGEIPEEKKERFWQFVEQTFFRKYL